ncbi:MAG: acyl-CoA thioesterase [Spirochaetaceae bacterium]|nr:acyl-CoA thioesterase [Spirochaetaceae bacterium]
MEMTRHRVTVRLHHTDAAGVLFYGRLFELVQEAFEEALRAGGLPLGKLLRDGGFRLPVVHAEADYTAPVRAGDLLEVRLTFAPGDRSLRVGADFVDPAGRTVAAARVVHAAVSAATGTAVPLPDAVRALAR